MDQGNVSKLKTVACVKTIALVFALIFGGGRVNGGDSILEKQERSSYPNWWKKYRQFDPVRNMPRVEDDPGSPFDVARMYVESDMVVECSLGNYLTETDHLKLVIRIADIGGVYKGQIPVTTLEPENANLQLCVMHDELGSHNSFVRLQADEKSRYLLFLKKVEKEERQLRGYANLKTSLFKVYRVWQGAIRLDGKSYLDGDANFQLFRDGRFKKTPLSPPDVLDAVKLMAASGASREGAMARIGWESRYLDSILLDANGAIRDAVPDEFRTVPGDVLETFTAEVLRSRYVACKDREKKLALSARIRFRAILWKDLAAFALE